MEGEAMKRWVALLSCVLAAGCGGPKVDMALIIVTENDAKRVRSMPSERAMAYTPKRLVVTKSRSSYEPDLQQSLADAVSRTVAALPGVEVVNTEAEADAVLRPEVTNARTSVRKTGSAEKPKWQLTGRIQGKIDIVDKKTRTSNKVTLNSSKSASFSDQAQSGGSYQKSRALKDALDGAVKSKKSELKRAFPMAMYIVEMKGERKYVKVNRGRIHKVERSQKLSLQDSTTGATVTGTIRIFQIDEETSWAESDESARFGALIGLKCMPVGR